MNDPIVVTRAIGAPPAVVYAYLIEGSKWERWQGVRATVEPRPGGEFAVVMANDMTAQGKFVELVPDRRVVFTWGWTDHPDLPPGSTTVEIDLVDSDEGTLLTLTHRDLPPEEIAPHTHGWNRYLTRLGAVAEGGDPGPDR
ncbi:MAG: SRPBCC domain-containing protein [Actinomycetota bacterium]|nr:SRPBCC domain-containing protein [Actinomycetota bacterium]